MTYLTGEFLSLVNPLASTNWWRPLLCVLMSVISVLDVEVSSMSSGVRLKAYLTVWHCLIVILFCSSIRSL